MKKILSIIFIIILISYLVYFIKIRSTEKSLSNMVDGEIITTLNTLSVSLKQFKRDTNYYLSEKEINKLSKKYYLRFNEKASFFKEYNFTYEVTENLKDYKFSAKLINIEKMLNDGGTYNDKYEVGTNLQLNNFGNKVNLGININ